MVETDGSHARFNLADSAADLYVVSFESTQIAGSAEEASKRISIDPQDLALVEEGSSGDFPGWRTSLFARDDGQVVGVLTRLLGALEDEAAVVRAASLSALSSGRDPAGLAVLLDAVNDPDRMVVAAAVSSADPVSRVATRQASREDEPLLISS